MADTKPVNLSFAMGLPPKDAVAYFESKGYRVTWDWREMEQRAHAQAFTVAKAAQLDILKDVREACQTALKEGKTEAWFQRHLEPKLREKGWWGKQPMIDPRTGEERRVQLGSPARLRLMYRQNMQTAYMAGRYKAMLENADARPWWQYVAILDGKTRPAHKLLGGRTFRFDDPFWGSHYPPTGFNCRCRVRALSDHRMEQEQVTPESGVGRMVTEEVTSVDRATAQELRRTVNGYRVPETGYTVFTDMGFSANPGRAAFGADMELARKLSLVQDKALRAQAVQALNGNPARQEAFGAWARQVLDGGRGSHADAQVVHFMRNEVAQAIREKGGEPVQVVSVSSRRMLHADSPKHRDMGTALVVEQLASLPQLFEDARQVLWDSTHGNIIYVIPSEGGKALKIVLDVPMRGKDAKALKNLGQFDATVNAMRVDAHTVDPLSQRHLEVVWSKE